MVDDSVKIRVKRFPKPLLVTIRKIRSIFLHQMYSVKVLRLLFLGRKRRFKFPRRCDYVRLSSLELVAHEIYEKGIKGSVAEVGVYKGDFAKFINSAFSDRKLYLFDTFEGFEGDDLDVERKNNYSAPVEGDYSETSVDLVLNKMPFKNNCVIKKGYFPESLDGLEDNFVFVSLDTDLYKPTVAGLEYFYPRLSKNGVIFIHDYNNSSYKGIKAAIHEFCEKMGGPL